jgi:hypothetical protein
MQPYYRQNGGGEEDPAPELAGRRHFGAMLD